MIAIIMSVLGILPCAVWGTEALTVDILWKHEPWHHEKADDRCRCQCCWKDA